MSRRAAIASQAKTRDELAAFTGTAADVDDEEDASFQLKDASSAGGAARPKAKSARSGGGGIALSDDEEEEEFRRKAGEPSRAVAVADEAAAAAADEGSGQAGASGSSSSSSSSSAGAAAEPAKGEAPASATETIAASDEAKAETKAPGKDEVAKEQTVEELLASMNKRIKKPKKKGRGAGGSGGGSGGSKKRKVGRMDQSLARLLAEDDKEASKGKMDATAAARAALALAGKMKVTEQVQFAGQSISVVRSLDKSSTEAAQAMQNAESRKSQSALDKIVGELRNPKKTISAVEKSSYDWDKFKEDKGIGAELEKTAREQSFVDKQAFLNRVDQRTFDVELAERNKGRAIAAAQAAKAEKK